MSKFFTSLWNGIKTIGSIFVLLFIGIGSFFLVSKIRQAFKGIPSNTLKWAKVINRSDQITICTDQNTDTWEVINLPKGVKSSEIKNVGVDDSQHNIVVEVKHEQVDRRKKK